MIVSQEVKARVKAKLLESIAVAESHYGQTFKYPGVRYTKRGRTAGVAKCAEWVVDFNSVLLMENVEDFLARTVPHEMAHLIDYQMNPENFTSDVVRTRRGGWKRTKRDIHGYTWQNVMRVLGAPTSRCHSYDTTNSRVKRGASASRTKHVYVCKGCGDEMKLGPQRHSKMQSGFTSYWMRGCKNHGGYNYVGLEGMTESTMPLAADRPTIVPPKITNVPSLSYAGSKLERCRAIYRDNAGASRQGMIELFVRLAGCTKAGGATYYAKVKKEFV